MNKCEHHWVYSNRIYCTYPAQQDRICSKCGEEETITCGVVIPYKDTYDGTMERFALERKNDKK